MVKNTPPTGKMGTMPMNNAGLSKASDILRLNPEPQEQRDGRTIQPDTVGRVLPDCHDEKSLFFVSPITGWSGSVLSLIIILKERIRDTG